MYSHLPKKPEPTRKAFVKVRINGIEYNCIKEAADILRIHRTTINYRLKNKWSGYERLD